MRLDKYNSKLFLDENRFDTIIMLYRCNKNALDYIIIICRVKPKPADHPFMINATSKKLEFEYIPGIIVHNKNEVGRGSNGAVYIVEKQFEERKFYLAVKIYENVAFRDHKKSHDKSDALRSKVDVLNEKKSLEILKEIKYLELLNDSDFLVNFYGCTSVEGHLGIVMSYVGNMSLKHWIYFDKSEKFTSNIPNIQTGIANGLAFLHKIGFAHNDFKSDKIMIDDSFVAKIIGLSQKFTRFPKKQCTANWRAPEYWDLQNSVVVRRAFPYAGDVFSFGIVLGELHHKNVEGKSILPWNSIRRSEDIGHFVSNGERPYSKESGNIPSGIYAIIEKCWQHFPKDRSNMSEVVVMLRVFSNPVIDTQDAHHNGVIEHAKRRELYENRCALGDANAMCNLGIVYNDGLGVAVDFIKARQFYEKGAALGNGCAINSLGTMYAKGEGVDVDFDKSRELYEQSMNLGYTNAMFNLGVMYNDGLGVAVDYIKARQFYEKGAALGNGDAMNGLGILYNKGLGVAVDYIKARELYQQSVNLGNKYAMSNLGLFYYHGLGVDVDYIKAIQLHENSLILGNPNAMNCLGIMYMKGHGVELDFIKARKLYENAVALGFTGAKHNLTILDADFKQPIKKFKTTK